MWLGRNAGPPGTTVGVSQGYQPDTDHTTDLVHDIFQRIGTVDGEADEKQVGLGVGKRSQSVIFFLARRVPQGKFHGLPGGRMNRLGDVVLKDRGDVFLLVRQSVGRPTLRHRCFSAVIPRESILASN